MTKIIILAGGLGTRISEETSNKPKPMVLINGKPMLWHIMKIFADQGFDDFLIATGYKGDVISNWVTSIKEEWKVRAFDTGQNTQTGGRIKKCMEAIGQDRVMATYGDGVANVNISELLNFHESNRKLATVTAVRPPARFGHLEINDGTVVHFGEKNQSDAGWINGGFFCFEPEVINYIHDWNEPLETGALPRLSIQGQLGAYQHYGFWQPMDTLREMQDLEKLAASNSAPWLETKVFKPYH